MTQTPDLDFSFEHREQTYQAKVWHFAQLTDEQRSKYNITENSFLVFLEGPENFKPFELFIGEDLEWHTKSTFVVDAELADKIGEWIDRKSN